VHYLDFSQIIFCIKQLHCFNSSFKFDLISSLSDKASVDQARETGRELLKQYLVILIFIEITAFIENWVFWKF